MSLELNALFRKHMGIQADLDSQEFRAQRAATESKRSVTDNLQEAEKNRADVNATKGMTHSGVNLQQSTNLKKKAGEATSKIDQDKNDSMAMIARKRLEADSEYNTARAYDPIKILQQAIQQ